MTDTIQTVKEDIALLQEKLKKLEELEHLEKPKSDVEEAYKRVYGWYPDTGICNGMSMSGGMFSAKVIMPQRKNVR
jgi:hypothetical protein